jgi:hypothetical protein
MLQAGVAPEQSASVAQLATQRPEAQVAPPAQSADVRHCAHVLVAGLQAGVAPAHAVALVAVHCTQAEVAGLQAGVAPEQFASVVQPPAVPHVPFGEHTPERHTMPPFAGEQGPSPSAKPQRLSIGSQTPLWQTSAPAAAVHVPFSVGLVCSGSIGMGVPFGRSGVHASLVSKQ